jgi:hypothetical protein
MTVVPVEVSPDELRSLGELRRHPDGTLVDPGHPRYPG